MRLQALVSRVVCVASVLAMASVAEAQATRTWVSGVGDDVNPCSRTAPCKTFAGAISKTATGGYINVIDPGGFGAVTIVKSITIDGGPFHSGILATGGVNGIIINNASAKVVLRNLSIEGAGTGNFGINVISANSVTVENVDISNFANHGINHNPSGAGAPLLLNNVVVRHSANNAILVQNARATITNSVFQNSFRGIFAGPTGLVTVRDSTLARNTDGVASTDASAVVNIENCMITHNSIGLNISGGGTYRVSNTGILSNSTQGILNGGASFVVSLSGNTLEGNPTPGAFTSTILKQ
jgi:hypothetical protein